MNENESILYIKIKLGKRSICVKYAIRFLSVAAFFLMIEQTSFFITRHAAKNMLADKEQKEILMRLPPKSESEVRVNAQMDIFLEEYSVDTGQLLFVEPYWDIRLAGMNEEELRLFLSDPSQMEEKDDRYKRIMAEFENYKKRSAKERETLYESIISEIVSSFLPVLDNLEKAVAAETKDEEYKKGVELMYQQFKDVLGSKGVKEIETVGKTFDPELHEAVSLVVDENLGEKEIKEEFRKGYMIGNRVIRHSMVIVAN